MKILFTSDLLKVDDKLQDKYPNPQKVNIDWIYELFSPILKQIFNDSRFSKLYGNENGFDSIRWTIYNSLGLQFTSESWGLLYEGRYESEIIKEILYKKLTEYDLVIGFELPPYIVDALSLFGIKYIDFTNHPIRFLPDYMFGVRTNIKEVQEKLSLAIIPDDLIYRFAEISKARTTRILQNREKFGENSAIFMGQIEIDSSLICNGRIADLEDVENALISLTLNYEKVFYKAHPHLKKTEEVKNIIKKIRRCEYLEINAYDAMALDNFAVVASMSSGSLFEAKYFGRKTKYFLPPKDHFDINCNNKDIIYYPIYKSILNKNFWDWLFNDIPYNIDKDFPDPNEAALKFSLNMKWGR